MKRLLLDLNVFLDVILDRPPDADVAAALWAAIERGRGHGTVPPTALRPSSTCSRKHVTPGSLAKAWSVSLAFLASPRSMTMSLRRALALAWPDFEDAVCAAAAEASACDALVTRHPDGYPNPPLPVIEPAAALSWLTQE